MKRLIAILLFSALAISASAAVQQRHTAVIQAKRAGAAGGPASPGTANLVAAWDFSDNLNDSGANGLTLGEQGSISYATGKVGNGLVTEADEWVKLADNALMEPGSGAWSVAFWANLVDATPAVASGLVTKGASSGSTQRSWTIRQDSAGTTAWFFSPNGNTPSTVVTTTDTRSDGAWFFCVCTFVPSTSLRIYINGSLNNSNTTSIPAAVHDSTVDFNIGGWSASTSLETPGTYDSVMIFNDELTADEITWLWNGGNGRAASEL